MLGQVDAKFILAIIKGRISASGNSSNFLALFDQHAVDERIRLESNIKGKLFFKISHKFDVSILILIFFLFRLFEWQSMD